MRENREGQSDPYAVLTHAAKDTIRTSRKAPDSLEFTEKLDDGDRVALKAHAQDPLERRIAGCRNLFEVAIKQGRRTHGPRISQATYRVEQG